jgi:hypothetical protein
MNTTQPAAGAEPASALALAAELRMAITGLDGYIKQRATTLAAPLIAPAQADAVSGACHRKQQLRVAAEADIRGTGPACPRRGFGGGAGRCQGPGKRRTGRCL